MVKSYGIVTSTRIQLLWTWTKKYGMLGLPTIYARHFGGWTVREWFTGSGDQQSLGSQALLYRRATPGLQRSPRSSGPAALFLPQAPAWFPLEDAHQLSPDTVT